MAEDAVSPVPASIPNAVVIHAAKPFTVNCQQITARHIADAIDHLANVPAQFRAYDLARKLMPDGKGWDAQEATNRLFQRWRKLGLAEFNHGRWSLTRGAWDTLQASAIEARRAETAQTGSVADESAGPKDDAQ